MGTRLNNKVALVTGAAQGIGRAIVQAFLAEGAQVIAADVNVAKLADMHGHDAVRICPLDVTDAAAIKVTSQRYRDVNVLVNCAGYVASGSVLTCSVEDMERSYRLNVGSVFLMTQAFLPAMLKRRHGSIINIASVVSTVKGAVDRCAYATSKGAVIALTKSVALDFIREGIRCNVISPGTVHSPSLEERMAATGDAAAAMEKFIGRQPMGRLGKAKEIAAVAVLLASDVAGFMTGSNVVIDGGFSI